VDIAIGLGIGILVRIITVIEGLIVVAIAGRGPTRGNVAFGTDPLWIVLNGVLVAALLGPVVEELVFRGLVLRAVRWAVLRGRRRSPRPQPADPRVRHGAAVLAVTVSAVLFAGLHLYEAIGDSVLLITLGLFTLTAGILHGVITIATGRLGPAIIAHITVNASSVLFWVLLLPHG
jgi:membrane protease YdiL (CAAX protease family)